MPRISVLPLHEDILHERHLLLTSLLHSTSGSPPIPSRGTKSLLSSWLLSYFCVG